MGAMGKALLDGVERYFLFHIIAGSQVSDTAVQPGIGQGGIDKLISPGNSCVGALPENPAALVAKAVKEQGNMAGIGIAKTGNWGRFDIVIEWFADHPGFGPGIP